MLTAFLTQFPPKSFEIRRYNFLSTPAKLDLALDEAVAQDGIVLHALVRPDAKMQVTARCRQHRLAVSDLTGQFVDFLSRESGLSPLANTVRLHDTSSEYHQRIKALEFTLEHDDGLGLDSLHQADIVLCGVSRTSKTPTSIYLAQQGYRVGNVSLAYGIEPPAQLISLSTRNVVGLVINSHQLVEIRTNRQASWRMGDTRYNDPDHVLREVQWSRRLFSSRGWPVLDVTDQAVEETAGRIVEVLRLHKPAR